MPSADKKGITVRISESPSSEDGCKLSDILEEAVPEGYFLSDAAMRKILKKSSPDRRDRESTIQTEQPAPNVQEAAAGAEKRDFILLT